MNENEPTKTTAEDLMLEQLAPGEEYRPVDPKRDDSYQQAEEHMAETFVQATMEKQRKEQKALGMAMECIIIAGLYLLIWMLISAAVTIANAPAAMQLLNCLTPSVYGIGKRMLIEKLPFREAASECKFHFIASAVLMVVGIVRLVVGY